MFFKSDCFEEPAVYRRRKDKRPQSRAEQKSGQGGQANRDRGLREWAKGGGSLSVSRTGFSCSVSHAYCLYHRGVWLTVPPTRSPTLFYRIVAKPIVYLLEDVWPIWKVCRTHLRHREGRGRDADGWAFRWDWELQFSRSQEGRAMSDKAGDRVELNVQGLK